jgi:molecular chaperone GrpE
MTNPEGQGGNGKPFDPAAGAPAGDDSARGDASQGANARGGAAGAGPAEAGDLQAALADAENRAKENQNQYLRSLAELDNVRKRAVRDVEQAHKYGLEKFAGELIGVKDSLELGLAAAGADAKALQEGTQATLKLFDKAFERAGLQEVVPAGQPFNPELHEAIAAQPSSDVPPNTVLQVIQKGYLLNGRLVRPARVIVSKEP